VTVGCVIIL